MYSAKTDVSRQKKNKEAPIFYTIRKPGGA